MRRRRFLGALGMLAAGSAVSGLGCSGTSAAARPREILIIRHAEEPTKESLHLNDRGRERADALVKLFAARFQRPQFLFAARPSSHTNRSVETLEPLSKALGLPIDAHFEDRQYEKLAQKLAEPTYANARVLICWQHAMIPDLAKALGVSKPPKWPDEQYDRVWQITYDATGPTLSDLPQALLPKDSR